MAKQNGSNRSSQPRSAPQGRSGAGQGASGGSERRRTASPQSRADERGRSQSGNRSGGGKQREPAATGAQRRSTRRNAVAGAGAKVVGSVKENPIPAALIGAGLTWLLVKNRQRLPVPRVHVPESLSGIAQTARESFSGTAQSTRQAVRDGVGSAAESVKSGASTVAEYAQSGASTVAEYAQSGAAKVGRVAKKGFVTSRDAVATTWDEHPLAAGLALLAAGVAAGMMLPAPKSGAITRAAKGLTQRVAATGEELLDSARELVSSSARSASREAKRQGLTPGQLGRKVKRVADAATP